MQNDMSVVLRAGKLLIESGAEVYRVEDTMKHFAKALQIENFEAYVVSSIAVLSLPGLTAMVNKKLKYAIQMV